MPENQTSQHSRPEIRSQPIHDPGETGPESVGPQVRRRVLVRAEAGGDTEREDHGVGEVGAEF
jgi:hypothetical protein